MKICITGGAGFIGSHVADAYLALGAEVVVIDDLSTGLRRNVPRGARFVEADIRDRERVAAIFRAERFTHVNHHAAQISVPASVQDPRFDADVNVLGLLVVLEACAKSEVEKFIFISSGGTVYGVPDRLPCVEDDPLAPASPYGIAKTAGEFYTRFYGSANGLRWTALRYSNVYGPRQNPHGEAGVVAIFCSRIIAGAPVQVFGACAPGDGGCERDYVYVGDVAAANVAALAKGDGEAFNIGTSTLTRTRALLEALQAAAGRTVPVEERGPRPGDVRANSLDPSKAARGLGWRPRTTLEAGLELTFRHFAAARG
ncbi:MAG TPA: NAD-dependent epimerase/dehydratase family protein [Planctomycetota bacterium]|jgi:UDP-glucose 4-epimerase|nr:NAD-dependent epimerase/dehydratase family protein [Planctomycetota bacterium]OQC22210.1 MAG: UDP-glucose 4-epimerase [Planctomycetes bacterium ADurb.Bin069]NMD35637.1 NAD-dependent epimerase/dehydratase family protein [Planctomycetota bacterium]HNS00054.1 NAD-dependent epimerase/dehydratase family protein [Planctomycetota bacterium]HNU25393.1 NAD-dependent epimerase/dehydratase family protein [Planctomycetota bacterium]